MYFDLVSHWPWCRWPCYSFRALVLLVAKLASGSSVWSCDDHGDVIYAWSEAWRSNSLKTPATVVHFDSHGDLSAPVALLRGNYSSQGLARRTDINDFILTAAALGKVDKVIWVAPPWSNERGPGLGNYILSEESKNYVTDFNMNDRKRRAWRKTKLVRPLHYQVDVVPFIADTLTKLQPELEPGNFILDIDLDVFATENPAVFELRSEGGFSKRDAQHFFEAMCLDSDDDDDDDDALSSESLPQELRSQLDALPEEKRSEYTGKAFLERVCRAPVHYSSSAEVQASWDNLFTWFKTLHNRGTMPGVVTIADSQDSYLPPEYLGTLQQLPFRLASTLSLAEPTRFSSHVELFFVNDLGVQVDILVHYEGDAIARLFSSIGKDQPITYDGNDLQEAGIHRNATFFFRAHEPMRGPSYRRAFAGLGVRKIFRLSQVPCLTAGELVPTGSEMLMLPLNSEL